MNYVSVILDIDGSVYEVDPTMSRLAFENAVEIEIDREEIVTSAKLVSRHPNGEDGGGVVVFQITPRKPT